MSYEDARSLLIANQEAFIAVKVEMRPILFSEVAKRTCCTLGNPGW